MAKELPKSRRALLRWAARGSEQHQRQVAYALKVILPILEEAGFEWVEKLPDDFKTAQANSISLLRERKAGEFDYIIVIFDKYRRPRFKVISGMKEMTAPFRMISAGNLVRYKSELDRATWWGPKWWQPFKECAFESNVRRVARLLPQVSDFLSNGTVGSHIWKYDV